MIIPEELLEQIERGNVLLFIGERIVHNEKGQTLLEGLANQLAARCSIIDFEDFTFPEAAQAYEESRGRQALVQFVRDHLEPLGTEPQRVHRLIASLADCNVLITTCFDRRLERAFEEAGRPLDVIIGDLDVAFEDERKTKLYKLYGSIDRLESLLLTEDDYAFFEDQTTISVVLQGFLARKTILFIGYELADPYFKRLYRKVTINLDKYARRAYAFGETPPSKVTRWCKRHGIDVVEANTTTFLEVLIDKLKTRRQSATSSVSPFLQEPIAPLPDRPYKFLDYYETKDAAIFFGRHQETQTLSALIHAHRLVLLYGASGVGKTSLLLAGAVPRLKQVEPPYETIYVRALEDPSVVIRRIVLRRLPKVDLPQDSSLVDFLDAAIKHIGHVLVIILDQFEEFFIRLGPQIRAAFIDELGKLYDAREVPVKVVLSLREDWLATVSELEQRIPEVFRTRMRLSPLTREQAHQAIIAPVEQLGVGYETTLVERLLNDLIGSEGALVLPPQLQLVCSALYDNLGVGENLITLNSYIQLGGVRGVLQQYLEDELTRFERNQRKWSTGVLEELVTSQGTKAVKSADELAEMLGIDISEVIPVLEKLVRSRLLRALEYGDGRTAYELAHEYLIDKIGLGREARKRKQVEEMIEQEVKNWQHFQELLPADKLARVNEVRETVRLSLEAQELILHSALEVGQEVDYWLNRVNDPNRRLTVVAQTAASRLTVVRHRSIEVLKQINATNPEVAPFIIKILLNRLIDEDDQIGNSAAEALGQIIKTSPSIAYQVVDSLVDLLLDEDRGVYVAPEALFQLVSAEPEVAFSVVEQVVKLLVNDNQSTQTGVAEALRQVAAANPNVVPETSKALVKLLTDDEKHIRTVSAETLGRVVVANPSNAFWVFERTTELLMDKARSPRDGAATALRRVVPPANAVMPKVIIKRLLELLTDSDGEVRGAAAVALRRTSGASPKIVTPIMVKQLIGLLFHADQGVRDVATESLGQIVAFNPQVTPQAIQMLLELLAGSNPDICDRVIVILETVVATNPKVVTWQLAETLLELLEDEDDNIRDSVADILGLIATADPNLASQMSHTLVNLLASDNWGIRDSVADALYQLAVSNPGTAVQLVEQLLNLPTDHDLSIRTSVAAVLTRIIMAHPETAPEYVAEVLAKRLSNEDSSLRTYGTELLGHIGAAHPQIITPAVATAWLEILKNETDTSYQSAVDAFYWIAKRISTEKFHPSHD